MFAAGFVLHFLLVGSEVFPAVPQLDLTSKGRSGGQSQSYSILAVILHLCAPTLVFGIFVITCCLLSNLFSSTPHFLAVCTVNVISQYFKKCSAGVLGNQNKGSHGVS